MLSLPNRVAKRALPSMTTEIYQGRRKPDGSCEILADGRKLSLKRSLAVSNHSPTGFEWSYAGSGPAQTALAILLDFTGKRHFSACFHQLFKQHFIQGAPKKGWVITGQRVRDFVEKIKKEEAALGRPLCEMCLCEKRMHWTVHASHTDPDKEMEGRCHMKGCTCGQRSRN